MSEKLPVSIVVCTYNDHQFLSKALKSCAEQNVDEIILVDDHSGEWPSMELRALIAECGAAFIRLPVNRGLAAARNAGFRCARNDYVIPLDADDWFYPDAVRRLYEERGDADVVCGDCTENGVLSKPPISRVPAGAQPGAVDWRAANQVWCSSLILKAAWQASGGYWEGQHTHYEDYRLWCEMHEMRAKFRYTGVKVYEHTPRPDSMLHKLHDQGEYFKALATEPLGK